MFFPLADRLQGLVERTPDEVYRDTLPGIKDAV